MIDYTGATAVSLPHRMENDFSFDAEELLSLVNEKTKLIILNSPANPTGGVVPKSEYIKLIKGLENGCSGIITATCNATSQLARKVYDDFKEKKDHSLNQKLVNVRNTFEKYNLISALHTLFSKENKIYGNLLPPLSLLSEVDERNLLQSLKDLNFETKSQLAA